MGLAIARLNQQLQRTVQSTKALALGAGVAGAGIGVAIERWSHDDLQRRTQDFEQEKAAAEAWVEGLKAHFDPDIDDTRRTAHEIQGRIEDYKADNPPPNGAWVNYKAEFGSGTQLNEPNRRNMWEPLVLGTAVTGAIAGVTAAAAFAGNGAGARIASKAGVAGVTLAGAVLAGAIGSNLTH